MNFSFGFLAILEWESLRMIGPREDRSRGEKVSEGEKGIPE
jgi:hypothetical protein